MSTFTCERCGKCFNADSAISIARFTPAQNPLGFASKIYNINENF